MNLLSKEEISKKIKNYTIEEINKDMEKLIKIGKNANTISQYSRIGNKIVDYFTFTQRLEVKGKYNINFFEFIKNIDEFKKKKFIQNMIDYYNNNKKKKNEYIVYKEIYNICISSINIMRPLFCMEIYSKYNPKTILNFCSGWGGSLISASALNVSKYIGIEINTYLREPYENIISFLKEKSNTEIEMYFTDSVNFDYSKIEYDLVFSSPPYYFIEKYENNNIYNSKKEMDELFYIPLFTKSFNGLSKNGYYVINICKEVYENVLIKLLGEANEIFPYKKSNKKNNYVEMVYVWKK